MLDLRCAEAQPCLTDGEVQQTHCEIEDGDLLNSASILEPYVAVRTNAGRVSVFHGEASTMELKQLYRPPDGESVSDIAIFQGSRHSV